MSEKIEDGGPAFPVPDEGQGWGAAGMTLRDWFAGQALAGMLADPNVPGKPRQTSEAAYELADAMLAARAKEPGA